MKPTIIAIVGASGSGKTTLSFYLQEKLHIPPIVSWTTRPMREGEVNGRDHYFGTVADMPSKDNILAHTIFAGHHYWTTHQQIGTSRVVSYVIDEKGLIDLENHWNHKYQIVPVYISRPLNPTEPSRLERDKERVVYKDYVCVIENNGSLRKFFNSSILSIVPIILTKLYNNGNE